MGNLVVAIADGNGKNQYIHFFAPKTSKIFWLWVSSVLTIISIAQKANFTR